MHVLQPKHKKLRPEEKEKLLNDLGIAVAQLPKIRATDTCIPEDCESGDVIKVEREFNGKTRTFYRVVV